MEPSYEITPQPTEDEREAILEALAADGDRRPTSPWRDALLPARDGEESEP